MNQIIHSGANGETRYLRTLFWNSSLKSVLVPLLKENLKRCELIDFIGAESAFRSSEELMHTCIQHYEGLMINKNSNLCPTMATEYADLLNVSHPMRC